MQAPIRRAVKNIFQYSGGRRVEEVRHVVVLDRPFDVGADDVENVQQGGLRASATLDKVELQTVGCPSGLVAVQQDIELKARGATA